VTKGGLLVSSITQPGVKSPVSKSPLTMIPLSHWGGVGVGCGTHASKASVLAIVVKFLKPPAAINLLPIAAPDTNERRTFRSASLNHLFVAGSKRNVALLVSGRSPSFA